MDDSAVITPPINGTPANGAAATAPDAAETERKAREAEIKATGARLRSEKDALNKQRAEVIAQEKALEAERRELSEFKKWRSQATTDPDQFLKPIYGEKWRDALAQFTTGNTAPLEVQKLRQEWEAERSANAAKEVKSQEDAKTAQQEAEKKAAESEEQAFRDYATEMNTTWIESHKAEFPTLAATGLGYQIAVNMRAIFQNGGKAGAKEYKPGEIPDEMLVAKDLEEKLDKLLDDVYATPKWSEKLAAKMAPSPVVRRKEVSPQFQYMPPAPRKAISSDMAASGAAKEQQKPLSREERRARLLENWSTKVPSGK